MEKENKLKAALASLTKQQKIIIAVTAAVVVSIAAGVFAYVQLSKDKTEYIDEPVTVIADADDEDASIVEDIEPSNLIEITDEAGNILTLIPINDVTNTYMISAYILSAKDSSGNAITDTELIGKVIAVMADDSSGAMVYSFKLDNGKKVFLDFYTNENKDMVAVQSYDDGKLYEVETTRGASGYIHMHLKSADGKNPIEVTATENSDGTFTITEKASGTVVTNKATKTGTIVTETTPMGSSPAASTASGGSGTGSGGEDPQQEQDSVIGFADYSELADINIVLKANTTAAVGVDVNSPIQDIDAKSKAYISGGALYLIGNGDYYISQESSSTWYGKIIVQLGNQGLARVRLAGVDITSSDSFAIEFQDTDTVINDTDSDGEVLVYKNTAATKNNPNAVLSFVDGTTSSLTAHGNSAKGSGTIHSQCKLSIKGHGTVNINAKNKNGIQAERSVAIQNCTMNVTSQAAKGIRVKGTLDIEENATITVNSVGDAIRCNTFIMDTDEKDANGNKDKSTGSTVTLKPASGDASPTTGDGIDADDAVIIRAGALNVSVSSVKAKWGVKVRRVNNEEFIQNINSGSFGSVDSVLADDSNEYYADVVLNEKEYRALEAVASVSPSSADYQGIRASAGNADTFRITGGTVKVYVPLGKNSKVISSTNTQPSISAYANAQRSINLAGFYSSGEEKIQAILYSGSDVSASGSYTVNFGRSRAGKAGNPVDVSVSFSGGVAYVTDV